MYTLLIILIVILAVLMCFVVMIQESKGGGLSSAFSSSNQIMGVRKTTDFIEKLTWGLAAAIVFLSIVSVFFIPEVRTNESVVMQQAVEQQAATNLPGFGASQPAVPQEQPQQ
jgi:preprotein translocase subunit SecG